jgi:hypothetical protein
MKKEVIIKMFFDDQSITEQEPENTEQTPVIKPGQLIYCGPNLPRGILSRFTVYKGGIPKHLDQHIEKCPAIRRLFVAPEKLNSTIQNINKAGTPESVWAGEILAYIQRGE